MTNLLRVPLAAMFIVRHLVVDLYRKRRRAQAAREVLEDTEPNPAAGLGIINPFGGTGFDHTGDEVRRPLP